MHLSALPTSIKPLFYFPVSNEGMRLFFLKSFLKNKQTGHARLRSLTWMLSPRDTFYVTDFDETWLAIIFIKRYILIYDPVDFRVCPIIQAIDISVFYKLKITLTSMRLFAYTVLWNPYTFFLVFSSPDPKAFSEARYYLRRKIMAILDHRNNIIAVALESWLPSKNSGYE